MENSKFTMEDGRNCPEQVVVLDLSNNSFKELDLEILSFDNLEELILDNHTELRTLPEELEYLPKLNRLSISGCNSALLSQLKILPGLEELNISSMYLPDVEVLKPVCNLKNLKKLDMNSCTNPCSNEKQYFRWNLPEELGNLSKLEWLSLDNSFLEKLPDSFCYLTSLQYLSIKNNYIETLPKGLLELDALKELYAIGNKLKRENKRFIKKYRDVSDFVTDILERPGTGEAQAADEQTELHLSQTVLKEIDRLGIASQDVNTETLYFKTLDMDDEEETVEIPSPLIQLLWGFNWNEKKLLWKEPPFSSEESWNDEAYWQEDEEKAELEKEIQISYSFYPEESFFIGKQVFLCIGCFQSEGQPYRLSVSLNDENINDPIVYTDDYQAEEPSHYDSLSGLLRRLTTGENLDEEYTAMNLSLGFSDESSNKFWEIKVVGRKHFIRFGKANTKGQSQEKGFESPQKALAEAKKLVEAKKKKGYEE